MKGWVYVISNRSMPGLVKVGYSTKDPDLRAEELNHTGAPHPYVVDYEVLVENPYQLEQRTHRTLAQYSEAKEWFRCGVEEAIAAIRGVAADQIINETFKRANRARALQIQRQKEQKEALERQQKEQKEALERQKAEAEQQRSLRERDLRRKYDEELSAQLPQTPFWEYWLGFSPAISLVIWALVDKISAAQLSWWSLVLGAGAAHLVKQWHVDQAKASGEYKAIEARRDEELRKLTGK